jgi:hypothetical protein
VVGARLGHADPSVTLRVYARVISDQLSEADDIFTRGSGHQLSGHQATSLEMVYEMATSRPVSI